MTSFTATMTPITSVHTEFPGGGQFVLFESVEIDDGGAGIETLWLQSDPEGGTFPIFDVFHRNVFGLFSSEGRTYAIRNTEIVGEATNGNIEDVATGEIVGSFISNGALVLNAETTLSAEFVEDFLEALVIRYNGDGYAFSHSGFVLTRDASLRLLNLPMQVTNKAPQLEATLHTDPGRVAVPFTVFDSAELTDNNGTLLDTLRITSSITSDVLTLPDRIPWRGGFLELDGTTLRDEATGVAFFEVSGLGTSSVTLTSLYVIGLGSTDGNLAAGQAIRMVPEQDAGSSVLEGLLLTPAGAGDRVLTVRATDYSGDAGAFDFTVTAASNFAPTLTGLPSEVFGLTQVTAPLDLASIDIEGDSTGEILTLTLTPDIGRFSATSGGGVTVAIQSNVFRASMTLTGTADALDAFLDAGAVSFLPRVSTGTELATISVTLSDGVFNVDAGDIAVTASDTPPLFSTPTNYTVLEGQTFVADIDVTDNADTEGDGITYSIRETLPDASLFTIDSVTGVLSFRAPPDFDAHGDDNGDGIYQFSVIATDTSGLTDDRVFNVTVIDDLPPVAVDDTVGLPEWSGRRIDLLANDSDAEGAFEIVSIDTTGTLGRVTLLDGGRVAYHTNRAFDHLEDGESTTDTFTYTIRDSLGQTSTATMTATVWGVTTTDAFGTTHGDDLSGTAGRDLIRAFGGNDTVDAGGSDDIVFGGSGMDILRGGGGGDVLRGQSGDDTLLGQGGSDNLAGGAGDDLLSGGDARDILVGGPGADTLEGGAGRDRFVFGDATHSAPGTEDRVLDFEQGIDRIDLRRIDADRNVNDSSFTFVGDGAFSGAGSLRAVASGTTTVIEADTDGDGIADFTLLLVGAYTLQSSDFLL